MTEKFIPFALGDRVAMRRRWLQSVMDYTYASASRRGTVVEPPEGREAVHGFAYVQWDGWDHPVLINVTNLVHANRIHLEAA
jgi:hypothetical protein